MKFGDFTVRDDLHEKNLRSAKAFAADIIDEAVYAETIGRHWRGWASTDSARSVWFLVPPLARDAAQ